MSQTASRRLLRPTSRACQMGNGLGKRRQSPARLSMSVVSGKPTRRESSLWKNTWARWSSTKGELNAYRIRKFRLDRFVDFFVFSCFVHVRQSDAELFRLALDIAQVQARQVRYIENTSMFAEVANGLGIRSVVHTSYNSTRAKLSALALFSE